MASKGFLSDESAREAHAGTKGTFRAAAQRAGMSTRAFAEKNKHKPGKIGDRARMALVFLAAKH